MTRRHCTALILLCCLAPTVRAAKDVPTTAELGRQRAAKWEKNIARHEKADRENPPPADGILFVGSSSIVGWDVKKWFPDLPVINHGFGGSIIADSVHFADRIILPCEPSVIVFYAGDNDIAGGRAPKDVLTDYKSFAELIHKRLPKTRIIYVSIKLCKNRWRLRDRVRETNSLIQKEIEKDPKAVYFDAATPLLDKDGNPRDELFKKDNLHLKDAGYRIWSEALRPLLTEK